MCVRLFICLPSLILSFSLHLSVFEDLKKKGMCTELIQDNRWRGYRKGFTWYIQPSVDNVVWELTDVIFHIKVGVATRSLSSNTFTRSD